MDWKQIFYILTWVFCTINYLVLLHSENWNFGSTLVIGWAMAILGWSLLITS